MAITSLQQIKNLPGMRPLQTGGYAIKNSKVPLTLSIAPFLKSSRYGDVDPNTYIGNKPPEETGWVISNYRRLSSAGKNGSLVSNVPVWTKANPTQAQAQAPSNQQTQSNAVDLGGYDPTPLAMDAAPSAASQPMPEAPAPKFMPGGAGASVDGGALGFRRKKSSARAAGMTTKGTSQFKIASAIGRGTGLNIGV